MPNTARPNQKTRRQNASRGKLSAPATALSTCEHLVHAVPDAAEMAANTISVPNFNQLHDPAKLMKILCEQRANLAIAQGRLQIVSRSEFRVLHDVLARFNLVDADGVPVPAIESARLYKRGALGNLTCEQGMYLGSALAAHAHDARLREEELWMFLCRNYVDVNYRACLNVAAFINNAVGELNIAGMAASIDGTWVDASVAQVIGDNAVPHMPVFVMPRDFILGEELGGIRGCYVLRIFGGLVAGSQHKIKAGISVHIGNLLHEMDTIPFMHISGYFEITHLQTLRRAAPTVEQYILAAQ